MELETLETNRLILKKFTPIDFNTIFENNSETKIREILGHDTEEEYRREKEKYEGGFATYNRSFAYFQLIEKGSNKIIGGAGFHNWYSEHRRAELGYALKNDSCKRLGYMTEALEHIIPYGFNIMDLNRIEAYVGPDNRASLRLMEKFHFTQEGLLKEHYFWEGKMDDSLVFGLLRKDSVYE